MEGRVVGDFEPEVVLGRVLKSFQEPVIDLTVEIDALGPGDLRGFGEVRDAALRVSLVSAALAALAGFGNVLSDAAEIPARAAVLIGVDPAREDGMVVAEHADRKDRGNTARSPISVAQPLDDRIPHRLEPRRHSIGILALPGGIGLRE